MDLACDRECIGLANPAAVLGRELTGGVGQGEGFVGAAVEARGFRLVRAERLDDEALEEVRSVPGGCVAYVVAGGEGLRDVDLLLRNDEGRLLTADTGPEPWASLERCDDPPTPGTARLEIVPFTGEGTVLLLHFAR